MHAFTGFKHSFCVWQVDQCNSSYIYIYTSHICKIVKSSLPYPGQGLYGAVGFSYASTADAAASSSDDDSDGDVDAAEGVEGEEEEAEDERMDGLAEGFGIEDFTYRLGKALEQEGRAEALARLRPRWVSNF